MNKKNLLALGNKNGELRPVWIAAHFPNRLQRELVERTSICSSVDRILIDELPVVTYRTLGFLLLGVARIYSKKVEYLYVDSNRSLDEIKYHLGSSRLLIIDAAGRSEQPNSIALPKSFELDAYDLGNNDEDSNMGNVKSNMEIVLADVAENDRLGWHTGKDLWDISASYADHASTSASASIKASMLEMSTEVLRDRFSLDECMDPILFGDTEEEVNPTVTDTLFLEHDPEWKNKNSSDDYMMVEDREHPDHRNSKYLDEEGTSGEMMVTEVILPDVIMLKPSPDRRKLSVSVDVTPQSKAPALSGEHKSDCMAVYTPAPKEDAKSQRKRKVVYDDQIVVSNDVFKGWLRDATDLVEQRKKAPDRLPVRKEVDFFQPIVPIKADFPSNLGSVISTIELDLLEKVEDTREPVLKIDELRSPNVPTTSEQEEGGAIAPMTPVSQSTSSRFTEIQEPPKTNQVELSLSSESEEELLPFKDVELDEIQMNEGSSLLGKENLENVFVAEKWSAVTKSVGSYLHRKLVTRRERGQEEALNLSSILREKSKKESALVFSEILILKTGAFINVKQEKAYDDIWVTRTSKLKNVFGSSN